jgi:hypothetical protein
MAEAEYVALRRMTVHELDDQGEPRLGGDGRPILRELGPGDPIPEAGSWSNLWREVRAGRVGLAGTPFSGPALADSMRRKAADTGRPQRPTRRRHKAAAKAERPAVERPRSREAAAAAPEPEPEQPIADVAPRSAGAEADPELEG